MLEARTLNISQYPKRMGGEAQAAFPEAVPHLRNKGVPQLLVSCVCLTCNKGFQLTTDHEHYGLSIVENATDCPACFESVKQRKSARAPLNRR